MKNITFSADEALLQKARDKARAQQRSLNDAFREWLTAWTQDYDAAGRYADLMRRLTAETRSPRRFTRDELNER
ncbi:MAG: hypothetical protein MI724_04840 [Spirochaetales bacterium]|nr:hypothetical protein [Spirochaetales bacterium]